jgi:NAD(P)-dependent dehydrogenase (short-subunit alcohol dehydrogenase family)
MQHSCAQTLSGKVAIISGSSSGIGAATARELSRRGASVVINYPFSSEKQNAENVMRSLPENSKSIMVEADLSTLDGPQTLAKAAALEFGQVDFLVNNAGISTQSVLDGLGDEELAQVWERVVDLNGRGTLLLTRAILRYFSPKNSRIINICSTTSRDPDPDMTVYAGSKGMVESFTRC